MKVSDSLDTNKNKTTCFFITFDHDVCKRFLDFDFDVTMVSKTPKGRRANKANSPAKTVTPLKKTQGIQAN